MAGTGSSEKNMEAPKVVLHTERIDQEHARISTRATLDDGVPTSTHGAKLMLAGAERWSLRCRGCPRVREAWSSSLTMLEECHL